MRTISRPLRKLEVVLALQEEGPSIAEILSADPAGSGGRRLQANESADRWVEHSRYIETGRGAQVGENEDDHSDSF
jgi:hypothetical protein